MDFRQLRYFLAVAEEQHFGRAAQRLHLVQPALSMQIRALERDLGGPLFIRTSRRVELTDAGKLLRVEAERLLAQAEHTEQIIRSSMLGNTGRVRVGFSGNAVFAGQLVDDLRVFRGSCPEVELTLLEMAPQAQIEAILGGQLDVGYGPALEGPPRAPTQSQRKAGIEAVKIGEWPFIAAIAVNHHLSDEKELKPEQLARESLIVYEADGAGQSISPDLRQAIGQEPKIIHKAANALTILALASSGLGLALVPASFSKVMLPNLTYKKISGFKAFSNLFLFSRSFEPSSAVRAFLMLARKDNAPI